MNVREGNKHFPLPADYGELSAEGQRQARVAVCQDVSSTLAYITGHMFFRNHYLAPQGATFYQEGGLLPTAKGHLLMLQDFCNFPISVEAFPRGQGKSTIFSKELPLREIVCFPGRQVVCCMASDKLVADKAAPVMIQLEENGLLIDDFGKMVPKKGRNRIFNKHYMGLLNNSVLEELTIGSKQRGTRTSRYILDDCEYDPDSNKQERYTELREAVEKFITRKVFYMINPKFFKFFWIGTMIGARSHLYHVCHSKEKKYRGWARRIQSGARLDENTGKVLSSSWPERYSVKFLQSLKGLDSEAFMTEVMNCPSEEKARLLQLSEVANEYTVDKVPPNLDNRFAAHLPDPEATMTYHYFTGYDAGMKPKWQIDHVNQREHFNNMTKIATLDYAPTLKSTSDLKAIAITGIDARNTWWRLDLWAGRMPDDKFWDFFIMFCAAWDVSIIAPETVATQRFLIETISRRVYEGDAEGLIPSDWYPIIHPVTYPAGLDEKGHRIKTAFQYRMTRGLFKVPGSYQTKWPFNEERNQFKYFTIDLSELKRDDIIDAGAMVQYVPHNKGSAEPTKGVNALRDMCESIKKGKPYIEGEEVLVGMPLSEVRSEYLAVLLKRQSDFDRSEKERDDNVWDSPVVVG